MIYTKDNMLLHEGEVIILNREIASFGKVYDWNHQQVRDYNSEAEEHGIKYSVIEYATYDLEGVPKLPRERFVKPVDVEALAEKAFKHNRIIDIVEICAFIKGFKAGYNANKNEFTREEMEEAWKAGKLSNTDVGFEGCSEFLCNLRQISIPSSIELENDVIVKVNW